MLLLLLLLLPAESLVLMGANDEEEDPSLDPCSCGHCGTWLLQSCFFQHHRHHRSWANHNNIILLGQLHPG